MELVCLVHNLKFPLLQYALFMGPFNTNVFLWYLRVLS